jgi:hypothetical protein
MFPLGDAGQGDGVPKAKETDRPKRAAIRERIHCARHTLWREFSMTTEVMVGLFAMVIGILAFWQRDRVSHWARAWNKRFGKPGEVISDFATPKAYGISGLLMATAGLGIVVFSLVTGQSLRRTGETEALAVIVVAGILMVILLTVGAVLLYRKYRK